MSEFSGALIYSSILGDRTVSINDDVFAGTYQAASVPANLSGNAVICDLKSTIHTALAADGNYGVKDAWFSGNVCTSAGGALRNDGASLTISGSTFQNGSSGSYGGAIYNSGQPVTISKSKFTGNSAKYGGALHFGGSQVQISDSRFTGNAASVHGGVMSLYNAVDMTVTKSYFDHNYCASGGVFYTQNTVKLTISGSTFTGNTSGTSGGVISAGSSEQLTVTDSLFYQNASLGASSANEGKDGGSVLNITAGSALISGSTFTGNTSAVARGAVYIHDTAAAVIENTQFNDNSCPTDKGWMASAIFARGNVTLKNVTFNDKCTSVFVVSGATLTVSGLVTLANSTSRIWMQNNCSFIIDGDALTGTGKVARALDVAAQNWIVDSVVAPTATENYKLFTHHHDIYIAAADAEVNTAAVLVSDTVKSNGDGAEFSLGGRDYVGVGYHDLIAAMAAESSFVVENYTHTYGSVALKCDEKIQFGKNVRFDRNLLLTEKGQGGAMQITGGTLKNVSFTGNTAYNGGAVYASSSPTIDGVVFTGNSATNGGGAVMLESSGGTLKNVVFTGNSATKYGGAIYTYGGKLSLEKAVFRNNSANTHGGAVFASGSSVVTVADSWFDANRTKAALHINTDAAGNISNSRFTGNLAGAMEIKGSAVIDGSTFSGNSASNGGAIIFDGDGKTLTITDSEFTGNLGGAMEIKGSAVIDGSTFSGNLGGAMEIKGSAVIDGSTFSGNSALNGGAIIFDGDGKTLTITDCEFTGNISTNSAVGADSGSAVHVASGTVNISDTVFSGNSAASAKGAVFVGAGASVVIRDSEFSGNTFGSAGYAASIFVRGKLELANVIFNESVQAMYFSGSSGAAVTVTGLITLKNSKSIINIGGAVFQIAGGSFIDGSTAVNKAVNTEFAGGFYQNGSITVDDSDKYAIFTAGKDLYVTGKDFTAFAAIISAAGEVYDFGGYAGPGYTSFAAVDKTISVADKQVALNRAVVAESITVADGIGAITELIIAGGAKVDFTQAVDLSDVAITVDGSQYAGNAITIATGVSKIGDFTITDKADPFLTLEVVDGNLMLKEVAGETITGTSFTGEGVTVMDNGAVDTFFATKGNESEIATKISGGKVEQNLVGGAYVAAGNTAAVDNVELLIGGTAEVAAKVYAGGYLYGNAGDAEAAAEAQMTVDQVNVNIDGGAVSTNMYGGAHARQFGNASVTKVNITVTAGNHGRIYAGGWAEKGAVSSVGIANVIISGGSVDYLYGGGANADGTTTVGATTITIENDAVVNTIFMGGRYGYSYVNTVNLTFAGADKVLNRLSGVSSAGMDYADATVVELETNVTADLIDYVDKFVINEDCTLTANNEFYLGNRDNETGLTVEDSFTTFDFIADGEANWTAVAGISDFTNAKFSVNGAGLTTWDGTAAIEIGGYSLTYDAKDKTIKLAQITA